MDDLRAISLTDQIIAAYESSDPASLCVFSRLHDQACHEMSDDQFANLQREFQEADERIWS